MNEIRFSMHQEDLNSWDDRLTTVQWVDVDIDEEESEYISTETTKRKVVIPTKEPSHEVLPGTWRTIKLIFSVIAAYTEFACDVAEINFMDTLMFQVSLSDDSKKYFPSNENEKIRTKFLFLFLQHEKNSHLYIFERREGNIFFIQQKFDNSLLTQQVSYRWQHFAGSMNFFPR